MSVDHALKPDYSYFNYFQTLRLEIIEVAEHFGFNADTIDKVISQWKNIQTNKSENMNVTVKFWHGVSEYKDAGNNNPYQELFSIGIYNSSFATLKRRCGKSVQYNERS